MSIAIETRYLLSPFRVNGVYISLLLFHARSGPLLFFPFSAARKINPVLTAAIPRRENASSLPPCNPFFGVRSTRPRARGDASGGVGQEIRQPFLHFWEEKLVPHMCYLIFGDFLLFAFPRRMLFLSGVCGLGTKKFAEEMPWVGR